MNRIHIGLLTMALVSTPAVANDSETRELDKEQMEFTERNRDNPKIAYFKDLNSGVSGVIGDIDYHDNRIIGTTNYVLYCDADGRERELITQNRFFGDFNNLLNILENDSLYGKPDMLVDSIESGGFPIKKSYRQPDNNSSQKFVEADRKLADTRRRFIPKLQELARNRGIPDDACIYSISLEGQNHETNKNT